MGGQNEGNVKELFEKFLDSKQAEQAVENVQKAEQILLEHPAPEPDDALLSDIKVRIARALVQRKASVFRRTAYRTAVIAAAVIILATIGVKIFEKGSSKPGEVISASIIPAAIWDSDDVAAEDAELAALVAETEQIEGEILALQLGENGGNGSSAITELEMELIEINSDFWKG